MRHLLSTSTFMLYEAQYGGNYADTNYCLSGTNSVGLAH